MNPNRRRHDDIQTEIPYRPTARDPARECDATTSTTTSTATTTTTTIHSLAIHSLLLGSPFFPAPTNAFSDLDYTLAARLHDDLTVCYDSVRSAYYL